MKFMIYGAYGYTGKLITEYAQSEGLKPVLAGRNEAKLTEYAQSVNLPFQVVDLADRDGLEAALEQVDLVIHCAGPFIDTAETMMNACIKTQTHYTDITGELDVFEMAHRKHTEAQAAGVILCPGVGFDVIPTDCVAARLKTEMPDAISLALGFDSVSGMSRGTMRTSVRRLGEGGAVRRNGAIETVPLAYKTRTIDFGFGEKLAMTIPWGDVSTAYYTTGIPSVEVYIPSSPRMVKSLKRMNWMRWLLRRKFMQRALEKKVAERPAGPNDEQLEQAHTCVWGEVRNSKGDVKELRLTVFNGYKLTSHGAIDVARHILEHQPTPGFYTPAKLVGPELVDRYLV